MLKYLVLIVLFMVVNGLQERDTSSNKTFIITSILEEPYLMEKSDKYGTNEGNDRFEGYCKDLADLLANHLAINYELRVVRDGRYGAIDSSDQWNGMIGELIRKEADIAVAPLTITSARLRVVDFTQPFMSLGISLMMKKPDNTDLGVCTFSNLFCAGILLWVFLAYIITSCVMYLALRIAPKNSCLGRLIGSLWLVFTLVLLSSYAVNLVTSVTVWSRSSHISSVEDLAKQKDIEYGVLRHSSTMRFFQRSYIPVHQTMYEFMNSGPHVLVDSYREGIKRVRESNGKYALLMESPQLNYVNERMPCDTMKVGDNLDNKGYGIATPIGSPVRVQLDLALTYMQERGYLAKMEKKWWSDRSQCHISDKKTHSWIKMSGCYFILIGVVVLSIIVAMIEFITKSLSRAKRYDDSLIESMRSNICSNCAPNLKF